jgi:microcystin degradation protein MlrC
VLAVSDARLDPDSAEAAGAAQTVGDAIARLAPAFAVALPSPPAAIAAALAQPGAGLVAVTDPADNPLSGGAGDTPGLFRALVEAQVAVPCVFASFADPGVVAAARRAGIGHGIDATLGGRLSAHFGAGVRVRAVVERLTDGVFRNEGPMEHGVERRCGATAVLALADRPSIRVIVTEHVVPADDPAFYALHGLDTAALRLLCVKAKNHFRAAFAQRCAAIIDCDAPGPACVDLAQLPFRHLRAPVH